MNRTPRQSNALHKGFELIAQELREKNLSVQTVLSEGIELEWTAVLVKEILFKRIAKLMFDRDSTTQLSTKELQEVWENMSRALGQLGISIPFPSTEENLLQDLIQNHERS